MLRRQYYQEIEQGHVTTQSKFNYGEWTQWSGYKVLEGLERWSLDCLIL